MYLLFQQEEEEQLILWIIYYLLKNTDLKINDINDKDTLKHISFNRKIELNNVNCEKIIYLYNDPLLAIKSHFRRNWAINQLKKHGNPHKLKEADVTNIDNFLEKTEKKRFIWY